MEVPRKTDWEKVELQQCANCGKWFLETSYSALCRHIMKRKPACEFECNKALKQL